MMAGFAVPVPSLFVLPVASLAGWRMHADSNLSGVWHDVPEVRAILSSPGLGKRDEDEIGGRVPFFIF